MFALIDCNNFFASCEQVFNPQLRNKPLVILSSNDGCVIARSKEAKALGIPMGAPAFQYASLFSKYQVEALSSNFTLYGDMSERVVSILEEWDFPIEVYSIDESFLKIPVSLDYPAFGASVINRVLQCTGLPVSVGIASTKTLAKVANRLAKKTGTGSSVVCLVNATDTEEILKHFPVEDLWGIGHASKQFLHKEGIYTAFQLKVRPDDWIRKHLKLPGLRLVWELRGISCHLLEDLPASKKGIISSRSFPEEISSLAQIKEAVAYFTSKACLKLRGQHSLASQLMVFLSPSRFSPFYHAARSSYISLPNATDYTPLIIKYAHDLLDKMFLENVPYKRAGVGLLSLVDNTASQADFLSPPLEKKYTHLMHTLDSINQKTKKKSVFFGAEGTQKKWMPASRKMSPHYTTKWEDILIVKC